MEWERDMLIRAILGVGCALALSTAASARDKGPQKVMPNGEKVICQTTDETGSLVRKAKRCYTRAQWDRIAEAARANGERLTGDHASGVVSN